MTTSQSTPFDEPSSTPQPPPPHEPIPTPYRERLPDTRAGLTHKFNIASYKGYLTVGLFPDGRVGEIFITMQKEGSTIGGLMDTIATLTSIALQSGVSLDTLVGKFRDSRFEPAGTTTNAAIPHASSVVDYIFRWLELTFLKP